ncbi:MAG: DUF2860 domain-containing protein [Desulfobacteraceae bacterium]|nr:MAG: DUF2860 domain-containing protein [Desulfobacteraceae bacterium]
MPVNGRPALGKNQPQEPEQHGHSKENQMILKNCGIVFLALLMGAGLLSADEKTEETKKSGFFGTLTVGGYYTSGKSSQLDQDDDNRRIDRLTRNEKRTSKGGPGALASLGYRFGQTGTEISLGSTIENGGALTLEALQPFAKIGEMKWSIQAGSGKTWKDPYVTGRDREETDEDSFGFGYKWEKIMKTGARIGFIVSPRAETQALNVYYAEASPLGAGPSIKISESNGILADNRPFEIHL